MKILLLNDNPVVDKLVTLSAQKTSDEVDTASHIEEIPSHVYDLLIVDDSVYNDDLFDALSAKIKYKKSLFICDKNAAEVESFSSILKKPFLPTDLVELFMMFEKEVENEAYEEMPVEEDQESEVSDELSLDEGLGESVLDDEEAQKVKDLLEENEEELSFDEEVESDIESLELDEEEGVFEPPEDEEPALEDDELLADFDMALDLEDEADVDISNDVFDDLDVEDDTEEGESDEIEEEAPVEIEIPEDILDEAEVLEEEIPEESQNLESEIQDAVKNLSQEDLESELDEDTLLKIATNEIDPLADLTSKDLKLALGEEVEEDVDTPAVAEIEDVIVDEEKDAGENNGVEALKKLLEALNDKDVAASMKGMKISINITLGEN